MFLCCFKDGFLFRFFHLDTDAVLHNHNSFYKGLKGRSVEFFCPQHLILENRRILTSVSFYAFLTFSAVPRFVMVSRPVSEGSSNIKRKGKGVILNKKFSKENYKLK